MMNRGVKPALGVAAMLVALAIFNVVAEEDFKLKKLITGSDVPYVEINCTNNTATQTVFITFNVVGDVSGGEIVYEFQPPYTKYSGTASGTNYMKMVPALPVPYVRGRAYWRKVTGDDAPMRSPPTEKFGGSEGCPTGYVDLWDYFCSAWWVILIAFFAIMSYRFFSGRAMDFQDYFEEFSGKK